VLNAEIGGSLKAGNIELSAKQSLYSQTLAEGGCYPKVGVATVPLPEETFGANIDAAGIAQWLGYDSAHDLMRKVSKASVSKLPANATAQELNDTLLAASEFHPVRPARTTTYAWAPPVPAAQPVNRPSGRVAKQSAGEDKGVCAQVRLQIEQEAVLTRKAVGATLEIKNESEDALENLDVNISIYGPDGELANDKFVILAPELTQIEKLNTGGGDPDDPFAISRDIWRLAPNSTGRARWIILPKDDAAPDHPLVYSVGGMFTYTAGGVPTSAPLVPGPVTVYPNAKLRLKYFHQRDVISDDPFTPEVEPAEPYTLAVMVHNVGNGLAKNFSITSAQPKIIENLKGLLIDFEIIATEVAGQPLSASLKASFGDLGPGDVKIGRWLLKSSLLGFFLDYSATFEHEDRLGGRETSLIDSVDIHELIHVVRALGALDDGKPDFLVNDSRDENSLPDTVYLSDDTTAPVASLTEGAIDRAPTDQNLEVHLTAALPAGWGYLRIPDPSGGQFRLARVTRSDGLVIPVNTNAWISRYTFVKAGQRPVKESTFHLLDRDSTGSYTLVYQPLPSVDSQPPTSAVRPLASESRAQFPVQWAGQDTGGSGVAYYDLFVSVNGGPYLPWLQKTTLESALYSGEFGSRYAFFSTATDRAGNQEAGHATPDAQTTVAVNNQAPVMDPVADQLLDEGDTLRMSVTATDPDGALQTLAFTLDPGAPAGMALNPATGELTWPTSVGQGGTTNVVTVRVSDNGSPALSAARTFKVIVRRGNHPPVLARVPDQVVSVGRMLSITNVATDSDLPRQTLRFGLAAGAPAGATIDPIKGILRWRPAPSQGHAVHTITVEVTDNGQPPLTTSQSFTVTVGDYLEVRFGSTAVRAGQDGNVPWSVSASGGLTNLSLVLDGVADRLANFSVQAPAPIQASIVTPAGSARPVITLAWPEPVVGGTTVLGQLNFSALANQPSAFVPLRPDAVVARAAANYTYVNVIAGEGRVVLIAQQPLLESAIGLDGLPRLILYGKPWVGYQVELSSTLAGGPEWHNWQRVPLTNLSQVIGDLPGDRKGFFRALEVPGGQQPVLDWKAGTTQPGLLTVYGNPGVSYQLQQLVGPLRQGTWQPLQTISLTNGFRALEAPKPTNAAAFFRLKQQ